MKEFKQKELKSSEYYSHIVGVTFKPGYELEPVKRISKGEPICTVRWFKTIKVGEYEEDLYTFYDTEFGYSHYSEVPLRKLSSDEAHRVVRDNKLYRQSMVRIDKKSGYSDDKWFDTDEEAMEFLEDVKTKCSQCGNKLL